MNHFLQNLIHRHQSDRVNPEANPIVQPRPRARFEASPVDRRFTNGELDNSHESTQHHHYDPDTGSTLTHEFPEIKPVIPDSGNQSTKQTNDPTQTRFEKPIIQPNHQIDDLNERIEALKLQFGQKPLVLDLTDRSVENQSNQPSKKEPELSISSGQSNNQDLSLIDEVNQRVRSILQHLNDQQTQQTDQQRVIEPERAPVLSDTGNNRLIGSDQLDLTPETTSNFTQPVIKGKEQNTENKKEHKEPHQFGLLQIPAWLTEIQADLNNRWQELNTQSEPEPVVNVTIGRVEVKAVQTDPPKQPKARNKPSGVMSLDDYLKQREHRGRA